MIFNTEEELRAHMKTPALPGGAFKSKGLTIGFCRALHVLLRSGGYAPDKRGRRGVVLFALNCIGAGVASHEWTHAAHYELTAHRGRKNLPLKEHEELAWLQGEFVRRFWLGFYRRFRRVGPKWRMVSCP